MPVLDTLITDFFMYRRKQIIKYFCIITLFNLVFVVVSSILMPIFTKIHNTRVLSIIAEQPP